MLRWTDETKMDGLRLTPDPIKQLDEYKDKIHAADAVVETTILGHQVMPKFNELTKLLLDARVSSGTRIRVHGLDYILINNPDNDAELSLMRRRDILTPLAPDEVLFQAALDLPLVTAAFQREAFKQLKEDVNHLNREAKWEDTSWRRKAIIGTVEWMKDNNSTIKNAALVVAGCGVCAVIGTFGAPFVGTSAVALGIITAGATAVSTVSALLLRNASDTVSDDVRRHNELIARRRQHPPSERAEAIRQMSGFIKQSREFAKDLAKRYPRGISFQRMLNSRDISGKRSDQDIAV